MNELFWIGPRESDILGLDSLFQGSVTIYGSNKDQNTSYCANNYFRINHNIDHPDSSAFILQHQLDIIRQHPNCRFMTYNPNYMRNVPSEVMNRMICMNSNEILDKLNNKAEFRTFAQNIVPMLNAQLILGCNCTYAALCATTLWTDSEKYVIQEAVSSGGQGTYCLTKDNEKQILACLDPENEYIVTGFIEQNIPLNMHAVIYDNAILLFPGSIQIIIPSEGHLLYRGADFPSFMNLPRCAKEEFVNSVQILCENIQKLGYRGVIGIDGIWTRFGIYILEVNNRFQGSTHILNMALLNAGLPSVQECTINAFSHFEIDEKIQNDIFSLHVPFSFFVQINDCGGNHGRYILSRACKERLITKILLDGFRADQPSERLASQYSVVFNTNIVSLCDHDLKVRVHPNLPCPSKEWFMSITKKTLTALKTALINQGIIISDAAKNYIHNHGKMREGTYFSLDIFIEGVYINCPLTVKFVSLSPFSISVNNKGNGLCLLYYGNYLADVDYDRQQSYLVESPFFNQICFFATDRLRIQNNAYCTFPKNGVGCRFCEVTNATQPFNSQDILNAIDTCFAIKPRPFRHIMIGGASNDIGKERDVIIAMCHKIRSYVPDMPIYLMCLPPRTKNDIEDYVNAGITEFSFNLEVYDRSLATRYMPGKGKIPLKRYLDALEWASDLVGRKGSVRCAFIAGLEPMDSVLLGIEEICRRGAAPILSVFRPIPGTEMEQVIPPSNEWLMELLERGETICQKYGLSLGPDCPACRNNTLTVVQSGEAQKYRKLSF